MITRNNMNISALLKEFIAPLAELVDIVYLNRSAERQ